MGAPEREKFQGTLWAEIRSKVRDSDLSAEDKVKMLSFLSDKAREAADGSKDPDLDGKLSDGAVRLHSAAIDAREHATALQGIVTANSAFVSSADQGRVRALVETASKLVRDSEEVRKLMGQRAPNIVERVGRLADAEDRRVAADHLAADHLG